MFPLFALSESPLLLAAAGDWIKIIIFLLIFLGPPLLKLFGNDAAKQQPQKRPRPQRPNQPPAPQQANDLDDLFRNVAKHRAPPQQNRGDVIYDDVEVIQVHEVDEEPEIVAQVSSAPELGSHVREHVATHMAEGRVTEHASHLGKQVGLADEKNENRLHEKFDHNLGALHQTASHLDTPAIAEGTDAKVWTEHINQEGSTISAAASIANMLRDPTDVRKAIILSEILTPRGEKM